MQKDFLNLRAKNLQETPQQRRSSFLLYCFYINNLRWQCIKEMKFLQNEHYIEPA